MTPPARPARTRPGVVAAAVGLVALAAGIAVGLLLAGSLVRADHPGEGSAEAGFARDMQAHHAQAVEMALLVRERSADPQLRQVALDIELTQQNQIGQMHGWLSVWGLPLAGTQEPMAWMSDHGHGTTADPDGVPRMPGLATDEQMAELEAAAGVDAERLFLELMIPHHRGGVDMARAVLDRTDQPEVRRLAQAMVDAQTAEIVVLEALLAER